MKNEIFFLLFKFFFFLPPPDLPPYVNTYRPEPRAISVSG